MAVNHKRCEQRLSSLLSASKDDLSEADYRTVRETHLAVRPGTIFTKEQALAIGAIWRRARKEGII